MFNIPQLSGKEVIKALEKIGFEAIRQKGSHIRLQRVKNSRKELLTIPNLKLYVKEH